METVLRKKWQVACVLACALFALPSVLPIVGNAMAAADQASCEAKAVSKDGKPLAGAAKTASIKKCMGETKPNVTASCEAKAVSKEGKKLAGAAKTSFMKKCEAQGAS